jgi:hypothetical protein
MFEILKLIFRWAEHVTRMVRGERVYRGVWWENLWERDPLGGPRCRWEDNIKMDLQKVKVWKYELDRDGSGKGQVAGTCKRSNELSGSIKFFDLKFWASC